MSALRKPAERPAGGRFASTYHSPVMVDEVVDLLITDRAGLYVDGTLGGGGHTSALLASLATEGRVIGIDRDTEAIDAASERLGPERESGRFVPMHGNFAEMDGLLVDRHGLVDGILLDLGISSHQVDRAARGFAFSAAGPLDMRMDRSRPHTAAEIVNESSEAELTTVLRAFGEEPRARKIARAILERRPLEETAELAEAVRSAVPFNEEVKSLSRVFQALRIAVNDELAALERGLIAALRVLRPGGRLAVIAYHSLEDRRVKHFLRYGNFENEPVRDFYGNLLTPWEMVTRKAVQPSEEEVSANPRSRSARLRVAAKREPEESGLGRAYDY